MTTYNAHLFLSWGFFEGSSCLSSVPRDREKLMDGMVWASKLQETETFKKAGIKLNTTAAAGECM